MRSRNQSIETMLVLTVAAVLVFLIFHREAALWCGLGFGVTGLVSGWLSRKIDQVWRSVAAVLGRISNTMLLSLVYLLVVVPVGLVRRARKKGLSRFNARATTNFIVRDHLFVPDDLQNPW
jgi:hypothetical protein